MLLLVDKKRIPKLCRRNERMTTRPQIVLWHFVLTAAKELSRITLTKKEREKGKLGRQSFFLPSFCAQIESRRVR